MPLTQRLQALIDAECARGHTHNLILRVQSAEGRIDFTGSSGGVAPGTRFPIASISKMFTATLILQLADEGRIDLDQAVQSVLTDVDLSGLHVVAGVDHSARLTLRHLLHQTSGIADYYEGDLAAHLKQGRDRRYDLEDVLAMTRALRPQAAPDSGRSWYSDTNYQLLGAVIEKVTGQDFDQSLQARICAPLRLTATGVLRGADPGMPVYHRDRLLTVPGILTSMGPDGGIVSTLDEMLIFLRAYMQNHLFQPENEPLVRDWARLFFPVQYGYGLMRIKLPRWLTLLRPTPELIGHSGASGSFAFYAPEPDIYLIGAFNQTDAPRRPVGFMLQVLRVIAQHRARQ